MCLSVYVCVCVYAYLSGSVCLFDECVLVVRSVWMIDLIGSLCKSAFVVCCIVKALSLISK